MSSGRATVLTNCRLCCHGELLEDRLEVSEETGKILKPTDQIASEVVDLEGAIIAPGLLELQTNGVYGSHFTYFVNDDQYEQMLQQTAEYYVTQGVTSFWVTLPTIKPELFRKILPHLRPRTFPRGATLMGAHVEGPYLSPSKPGAHNPSLFLTPETPASDVYGAQNLEHVKLITLAPELPGADEAIADLSRRGVRVSLGHSNATFSRGKDALSQGATGLTHVMNAMAPLHQRDPGLAGLVGLPDPPFFSLIADGKHLDPTLLAMLARAAPERAIVISDSIECAGLPDGVYPANAQVASEQEKRDGRVVLRGTETLVGGCVGVIEGVRNVVCATGASDAERDGTSRPRSISLAGAIRMATENIASFMGLHDDVAYKRGALAEGHAADFVILDDRGGLRETWIGGRRVWSQ